MPSLTYLPMPHHEQDFTYQKFRLLDTQHDLLRRHVQQRRNTHAYLSSPMAPALLSQSSTSSTCSANEDVPTAMLFSSHKANHHKRTISLPAQPLTPIPHAPPPRLATMQPSDEEQLREVNLQIKTTLTELLNCEQARHDEQYRAWVQGRLMEAERELKGLRYRRRSIDTACAE